MKLQQSWLFPLLSFLVPFASYVATLAPTYLPVDSPEFALCAHFWGICHPPGFPLYITIGNLFINLFPFGESIYKLNLLSALFGALTILMVYHTLTKLKVKPYFSFLFTLMLALTPSFWELSTVADIFTFTTFLLSLTLYCVLTQKRLVAFLTLGLLTSHYYISILLFPLLLWYFFGRRFFQKALLIPTILFCMGGIIPLIILLVRIAANPSINWGHVQTLREFMDFITRKEFGAPFIISNSQHVFSITNLIRNSIYYLYSLLINFGIILPLLALWMFLKKNIVWTKELKFVFFCFLVLLSFQIFSLSSLDLFSEGKYIQAEKFNLPVFLLAVVLIAFAVRTYFETRSYKIQATASFLLLLWLVGACILNLKNNNFSKNYFTRHFVQEALSELPQNSLAITLRHHLYFGALYEQKISKKYNTVHMLYYFKFPDKDAKAYDPEVFAPSPNQQFIHQVKNGKHLNQFETYILDVIARNLDRPVFILQGRVEATTFQFLMPSLKPYGLWWTLQKNDLKNLEPSLPPISDLTNAQKEDAFLYSIAYHSTALAFAKKGELNKAETYFQKSLLVLQTLQDQDGVAILQKEIATLNQTQHLQNRLENLIKNKNIPSILELGGNYYQMQNYKSAKELYLRALEVDPDNALLYSNIGSTYALLNEREKAVEYYTKALKLNPSLELAKRGLKSLK